MNRFRTVYLPTALVLLFGLSLVAGMQAYRVANADKATSNYYREFTLIDSTVPTIAGGTDVNGTPITGLSRASYGVFKANCPTVVPTAGIIQAVVEQTADQGATWDTLASSGNIISGGGVSVFKVADVDATTPVVIGNTVRVRLDNTAATTFQCTVTGFVK